jgi:hypothetical protein
MDFDNEESRASVLTLSSGEYPAIELAQRAWGPRSIALGWTQQKIPPPTAFLLLRVVA